ncbi:MAG: hypothetical protein ABJA76_06905 [Mucilaginibacter sp.]
METLDEAKNLWQNTNQQTGQPLLNKVEVENIIKLRIKKEKKNAAEYFWLSFAYQILIYAFGCYVIIKYWGDGRITLLSAAGVLLYIPLTVILMRKFKAMFNLPAQQAINLQSDVKNQYTLLSQFFSFKKRFDLLSLPLTSAILTGILFTLYVPGGVETHLAGAIIACLGMLLVYGVAARFENKKHFVHPLNRLRFILEDIGD